MSEILHNWAGNIAYGARAVHSPGSVAEVQAIVRGAAKVRALGSRHSFNRIADTDAELISLRGLNRVIAIDKAKRQVVVEGGITYGELCPVLDAAGFALHNLASLPHISVVGAITTATHGSGEKNRNLAAAVAGLKIVTASGEILSLSRGDARFDGAVVSLGALGIVSEVTLDVQPRFEMRQNVYLDLPFAMMIENFDALVGSAYSVSFFTGWNGDSVDQVWLKALADAPLRSGELFGARPAERPYHPIAAIDATPCTEQMGVAGPWHLRMPHFRMEFTPSAGAELQSEYFVGRADAVPALKAIHRIQERIAPHLLISEIRMVAADDHWMSMNHQRDSVGIHFTWKQDWPAVSKVLPQIEAALAPFNPRPHWGKLFTMEPHAVKSRYARLGDFRALLGQHDPAGKFRNAFVDDYIF
ncbi:MAG TPA: FAD-binding protein [Devosia sp.]|nr:FAD-binding protein [Devosia sp.]